MINHASIKLYSYKLITNLSKTKQRDGQVLMCESKCTCVHVFDSNPHACSRDIYKCGLSQLS